MGRCLRELCGPLCCHIHLVTPGLLLRPAGLQVCLKGGSGWQQAGTVQPQRAPDSSSTPTRAGREAAGRLERQRLKHRIGQWSKDCPHKMHHAGVGWGSLGTRAANREPSLDQSLRTPASGMQEDAGRLPRGSAYPHHTCTLRGGQSSQRTKDGNNTQPGRFLQRRTCVTGTCPGGLSPNGLVRNGEVLLPP